MDSKVINFYVFLRTTKEKFKVPKCSVRMKIIDLKALLEFITGIPANLQKLCYLDEGLLIDNKEIKYYDLIEGAIVNMDVFTIYVGLVKAISNGNFEEVLKQGVSLKVPWNSPAADYMFQREKILYIKERAGVALFIASHKGNLELVESLVSHDANINYQTGFGRTPIMVSVVNDKIDIVNFLLKKNADIDLCDDNGDNALDIARKFKNKIGQNSLLVYKWNKRALKELSDKRKLLAENGGKLPSIDDRFSCQMHDSAKKTWLKGDFAQIYMMQLRGPNEFSGTGFSAPKALKFQKIESKSANSLDETSSSTIQNRKLSHELWLKEKEKIEKKMKDKKKKSHKLSQINKEDYEFNNEIQEENTDKENENKKKQIKSKIKRKNDKKTQNNSDGNEVQLFNIKSLKENEKKIETYDVYYGMPYDEWTKTRDRFLSSHNMTLTN